MREHGSALARTERMSQRRYHTLQYGSCVLEEVAHERVIIHVFLQSHEETPRVFGHLFVD